MLLSIYKGAYTTDESAPPDTDCDIHRYKCEDNQHGNEPYFHHSAAPSGHRRVQSIRRIMGKVHPRYIGSPQEGRASGRCSYVTRGGRGLRRTHMPYAGSRYCFPSLRTLPLLQRRCSACQTLFVPAFVPSPST